MTRNAGLMLRTALKVLHRQRDRAMRNTRHREAYKVGLRNWRAEYGEPSVTQVWGQLQIREWRKALCGLWTLLRCYPAGLASVARFTASRTNRVQPR
jgi:hypothetical protein